MARSTGKTTQAPGPLKVWIAMGSDSDLPIMEEAARTLDGFGIPYQIDVTSAHRTPHETVRLASGLEENGFGVAILGAGHAAHLAGVVAAHTILAAQILATADPDLRARLRRHKEEMARKVIEKNRALKERPARKS